ncbi:hypothetical protein FQN57_005038 [Myotisia sp. PD_48]|nr:hypothetical protein FQN57_005038 [Myotisia sp. PD_48]
MSFSNLLRHPLKGQLRSILASRIPAARPSTYSAAFHSSPISEGLKEHDKDREDLIKHYETEKAEHLRRQKEGKQVWTETLASASEADVKADRNQMAPEEEAEMIKEFKRGRKERSSSDSGPVKV